MFKKKIKQKIHFYKNVYPLIKTNLHLGKNLCYEFYRSQYFSNHSELTLFAFHRGYGNLRHFFNYHIEKGVDRIVLLDLTTDEKIINEIKDLENLIIYRTKISNISLKEITIMLNYLRLKFGSKRWCLTLETCEYIRFPYDDEGTLPELISFLSHEYRRTLFGIIVIMYPSEYSQLKLFSPENCLNNKLIPFFDGYGYIVSYNIIKKQIEVKGGVLKRLKMESLFPEYITLNRIPIVKLGKNDIYMDNTSRLLNTALNHPSFWFHQTPTCCIEVYRKDIIEEIFKKKKHIFSPTASIKRLNWRDFYNYGLISLGQFF